VGNPHFALPATDDDASVPDENRARENSGSPGRGSSDFSKASKDIDGPERRLTRALDKLNAQRLTTTDQG